MSDLNLDDSKELKPTSSLFDGQEEDYDDPYEDDRQELEFGSIESLEAFEKTFDASQITSDILDVSVFQDVDLSDDIEAPSISVNSLDSSIPNLDHELHDNTVFNNSEDSNVTADEFIGTKDTEENQPSVGVNSNTILDDALNSFSDGTDIDESLDSTSAPSEVDNTQSSDLQKQPLSNEDKNTEQKSNNASNENTQQNLQPVSGLGGLLATSLSLPAAGIKGINNQIMKRRMISKYKLDLEDSLKNSALAANKALAMQNFITKNYPDFSSAYQNSFSSIAAANSDFSPYQVRQKVLEKLKNDARFKDLFEDESFKKMLLNYEGELNKLNDSLTKVSDRFDVAKNHLSEAATESLLKADGVKDLLDPDNGVLSKLKAGPSISSEESIVDKFKELQEKFGETLEKMTNFIQNLVKAFGR